jgi:hypothetical protein
MGVAIKEISIGFSNTALGPLQTPVCIRVRGYDPGPGLTAPTVRMKKGTELYAINTTGPTPPTFVPDGSTPGCGVVYAVMQIVGPSGVSVTDSSDVNVTVTDGGGGTDCDQTPVYTN